jgi:DNA modification methylase
MESTRIKLSELEPNAGQVEGLPVNPRQWTKGDVTKLAKSLKETPELFEARPIIVYPHGGKYVILGGNMRFEACRENKDEDAPCVIVAEDTPVQKLKEIVIKDNGTFGAWDYDALANEWDDLPLVDMGVPTWNAEEPEGKIETADTNVSEDEFDEEHDEVETRCKPGDIWQLGEHRLLCGDSTDEKNFCRLLEGKFARLCVTSPPYGVGKDYEEKGIGPWKKTIFGVIDAITKHARIIVWNIGDLFATGSQFIEPTSMYSTQRFKENGFPLMYARIWKKQGGNFAGTEPYYTVSMKPVQEYEWLLCYGKGDYEKDYAPIIKWLNEQALTAGLNNAVLKEITGAGFMFGHWFTSHQWAMIDKTNYEKIVAYCRSKSIKAFERDYEELRREYENLNIYGKILPKEDESAWGQWAIWEIATVNRRTGDHPAEFPVELPARFIKMHSRPGDIILEPFCGSGTTLIAAEQLGRICYGVELDPHYCDIIIARWEKLTGAKAEKV